MAPFDRFADAVLKSTPVWRDPAPIREELFSLERLENHARSLAAAQPVAPGPRSGRPLNRRLADNQQRLVGAYQTLSAAAAAGEEVTPAAQWLLDNFHVVEEQVREIRRDLPPSYYRQLPKLISGPFEGLPRVFGIAWAFVAHTDSRFEAAALLRFVSAYQAVQPLSIGELWAVAITLRLVLLENLRRIADRLISSRESRQAADALADRVLGAYGRTPEPAETVLVAPTSDRLSDAFAMQLLHRLRDQDASVAPVLTWLDARLAAQGATGEEAVRGEHERQVAATGTVRNIITSLRRISETDWLQLFEAMSLVDAALDADGGFSANDFATRNLYRDAVEALARGAGCDELTVARAAVAAADQGQESRQREVGHHLIGAGRRELERRLGLRVAWPVRLRRRVAALGVFGYAAAIIGVAGGLLGLATLALNGIGASGAWLVLVAFLGAVPTLEAAVALVNAAVTHSFRPTLLPGLELAAGVPSEHRTLVAVPILLNGPEAIDRQVDGLEVHHLASLDGDLHYALLSDWVDHDAEHAPEDAALLRRATDAIAALNAKYGPGPGGRRFLLLHRRRVWSESERRWMGWERKRGKLHELNRLLRGAQDTSFIAAPGEALQVPPSVRYVLTLDADTRLPPDTVRRLIGKMAHPLNRPRLDEASGRIVEGYGLLQPRITPSLPVGERGSVFQRLFSAGSGLDPYAAAVSDVYQDLFGEGSYAGKGIYDVDAFEAALTGRVPDGALLSHDLFEGIFVRAGLASDVEVVEDAPERYDVAALRHHRWARGDWQLLPWILGLPPARGWPGRSLPLIGRLKMLDNLRRTLTAPTAVLALLAGWAAAPAAASAWTLFILLAVSTPALMPLIDDLAPRRAGVRWRDRWSAMRTDVALAAARLTLLTVLLAHQAWLMGDAILRTLWRVAVSRRRLLQWVPAADLATGLSDGLAAIYRRMAGSVWIALGSAALAASWARAVWPLAGLFVLAWAAAPAVARQIGRPRATREDRALSPADELRLRLIARRTWRYFETHVTAEHNHLPPDNAQEDPPAVAPRTSPTNIGLYLLSVVSALDFGWIDAAEAAARLEATFATLARLTRFRGHFLNWYDTHDLRPLEPLYVSSVDSGNLAGHLIALANACAHWRTAADQASMAHGAADAVGLAREELTRLWRTPSAPRAWGVLASDLDALEQSLRKDTGADPSDSTTLAERLGALAAAADNLVSDGHEGAEVLAWLHAAEHSLTSRAEGRADPSFDRRWAELAATARRLALEMEYGFLLDPERRLLSIGYRVAEAAQDANCYDLLASEARLASFVAIAKGDVAARHWFRLGHAVTATPDGPALISWSGSMFEYLMPSLVMRSPVGSVLERSLETVVQQQIAYGRSHRRPWGVSEAAFNARDLELTYQYSNFGLPGLALKRGLEEQAVVAPYATALAAMFDPAAAVENFAALQAAGAEGSQGYFEALDYTPTRVPEGRTHAVVRAFMAHHQGMTIVALANVLLDGRMRDRFHAEPMVQAAELLLHERMPRDIRPPTAAIAARPVAAAPEATGPALGRRYDSAQTARPTTHLMSNGRYSVMLTGAGAGYSRWKGLAVTRWREDVTCDDWGSFLYVRDVHSGEIWSAGAQPIDGSPDAYRASFFEDRAELWRRDGDITTELLVLVSPEDDAELRRLRLTNAGNREREIEVTAFAELALADPAADAAHPAFSKLFVETEHLPGCGGALLAHRRPRAPDEPAIWAAQLLVTQAETLGRAEFETDRARFLGRGRTARSAQAITEGRPLTGQVGAVLDPAFVLRRRLKLAPGATAHLAFWTMAAESRDEILALVDQHLDPSAAERAITLAWTHAQVQLRHLGVTHQEAHAFQRLAAHVVYANPALRPPSEVIQAGAGGQAELWRLGISGDLPIVLLRIADLEHLETARELLHAAEYWRLKRLPVDVVIINERATSYVQDLQASLEMLVRAAQSRRPPGDVEVAGQVFVLRADVLPSDLQARLAACARVVLSAQRGRLGEQLQRLGETAPPPAVAALSRGAPLSLTVPANPGLEMFNGFGGFANDGQAYVVVLGPGESTPAPWTNVICNPSFGTLVSAEGAGFTWASNSREHQLTPWSNDPVSNRGGEAIYVKDRDSGEIWSPTAWPVREPTATYVCRHGRSSSRFKVSVGGLELDLQVFVRHDAPVKVFRLHIHNVSARPRRLAGIAYAEWVLGRDRAQMAPFIVTAFDVASAAVFAECRWDPAFADRTAFLASDGAPDGWTTDRRAFIGRNGHLAAPAGLSDPAGLSGAAGAGLDPCAALERDIALDPGATAEIVFFLGEAETRDAARELIADCRGSEPGAVLATVDARWSAILDKVQVQTPDRALDLMLNGRWLHQTLASRLWARAGFYQASGAYGFRDQLQDVLALMDAAPELAREHILRAAGRQFPEGDVQHWWLPHSGQGVRTRFSDDRLWLPYVVAHYLAVTEDTAVLEERTAFLEGERLEPEQMESFFRPETGASASLYEHCARALDASLAFGGHGLPLIGGGDWNDGMNRVGARGRGESVWLGWFLYAVLSQFAPIAERQGDAARAASWRDHAKGLARALEREAWDGDWYLRGWYDDGAPLGSAASPECRIDSIAQSWAVLSGGGDPQRSRRAMQAVERELIDPEAGLALLFTPPFDAGPADPGYIKGYPPGVRENGGQYTHAAAWSVMALARLGEGDRAAALMSLLNPINHSRTRSEAQRYKVEPYVAAADVYAHPPHGGRGGWTGYTGAAGWLHRAGLEGLLGLRRRGLALELDPCIPRTWPGYQISYRHGASLYVISIENPDQVCAGVAGASLDGVRLHGRPVRVPLRDDGVRHEVWVRLGAGPETADAA